MNQIRLAKLNDIDEIIRFINDNWKEDHILARNKDFFIYEHKDKNTINFVISLEKNKINGVLGFIKYSDKKSDVATVIWKALKNNNNPMLGIEIFDFLRKHSNYNVLFSPGINAKTIAIYEYLGIYTDHLAQYVMVNKSIQSFNILKVEGVESIKKIKFFGDSQYRFVKLKESELDFNFDNQEYIPYKDKSYFIKRYFNHPVYKYDTYGVYKGNSLTSLIVTREVTVGNSKILRIMDYLGDENDIVYVSKDIYQIIIDNGFEYVDFMIFGFMDKNLIKAGFTKINLESTQIIAPNYFSPFIQENIKINFMADTKEVNKLRICKADGDQDRPN